MEADDDLSNGSLGDIPEIGDAEYLRLVASTAEAPPDEALPEVQWVPSLLPKQLDVFFDTTANLCVPGSRYTGKGWSCAYRAVKEAYDWWNNLVIIVVRSKRQGLAGGIFAKLFSEILPDFEKNISGFYWSGPKQTAEKDLIVQVKNRYGGMSVIQLMSIPSDQDVQRKIKGLEAGCVVLDEGQLFDNEDVYIQLSQTLGRRNHIPPERQCFIINCNPREPAHWIYQKFFVEPYLNGQQGDPMFRVIELKPSDNPDPKVISYYAKLRSQLRNKPTLYKRDIEGLWVAAPVGDAIFGRVFNPDFHVKGSKASGERLLPSPHAGPIVVGWDVGDTNHGVVFLQERLTADGAVWLGFDEVVHTQKRYSMEDLTAEVMDKRAFWGRTMGSRFRFTDISDRSAFDRFRAASGSYDHLEIQKFSKILLKEYGESLSPISMIPCPKPPGSVGARMRILETLLEQNRFFLSVQCERLFEALANITGTKNDPYTPDTHSQYKHAIDALTYPMFYMNVGGPVVADTPDGGAQPQITPIGS